MTQAAHNNLPHCDYQLLRYGKSIVILPSEPFCHRIETVCPFAAVARPRRRRLCPVGGVAAWAAGTPSFLAGRPVSEGGDGGAEGRGQVPPRGGPSRGRR